MVNILDFYPEYFMVSDAKQYTDGTKIYNLCYSDKIGAQYIAFNNIDCYFKKSGNYNFLVFCDNDKKKYDKHLSQNY